MKYPEMAKTTRVGPVPHMGGSDHTISLEFRVPSDLDDDFNVYRHTAKLEFYSNRKPQYRAPPVNNTTGKIPGTNWERYITLNWSGTTKRGDMSIKFP